MRLTVLGSGCGIPSFDRGQSGYLLEVGGTTLLFDCGAGTIQQMMRHKVDYRKIDAIFVTHLHTDHINDLSAFCLACNLDPNYRKKDLRVFGPMGLRNFFKKMKKTYPLCKSFHRVDPKITELGNEITRFKNLEIMSQKVLHTKHSLAFRVTRGKKVFAYSGDTSFCPPLIALLHRADLALVECSFLKEKKGFNHLSAELCGYVAAEAFAKRLLLTHFYPETDSPKIIPLVKKFFKGKIEAAKDGKKYDF